MSTKQAKDVQGLKIEVSSFDTGYIVFNSKKMLHQLEKTVIPVVILGDTDVSVHGVFKDGSLTNGAEDYSVSDPVLILQK